MARKKTMRKGASDSPTGQRRIRRTAEQIIAELKQKIAEVEGRAAARELKKSPAIGRTLTILRALDKTMSLAEQEGENRVRHALAEARKPLAEFLTEQGMKLPKARMPRGRKPGKTAAI